MTAPPIPRPTLFDLVNQPGGQQLLRVIPIANPAAGADWTTNVPPGVIWRPQSIRAQLNASAVVATRGPSLRVSYVNDLVADSVGVTTIAASGQTRITWTPTVGAALSDSNNGAQTVPLAVTVLTEGMTIAAVTANIQAADQWAAIVLYVLEQRPPLRGQQRGLDTQP